MAYNPAGVLGATIGYAKRMISLQFVTRVGIPSVAGFVGSRFVGNMIHTQVFERLLKVSPMGTTGQVARFASDVLGVGATTAIASMIFRKNRQMAEYVFLGGAIRVVHSFLQLVIPADIRAKIGLDGYGMGGMGAGPTASALKEEILRRLNRRAAVSGVGEYLRPRDLRPALGAAVRPIGEYLDVKALQTAPSYSPSPAAGSLADHDPFNDGGDL